MHYDLLVLSSAGDTTYPQKYANLRKSTNDAGCEHRRATRGE